MLIERHITRKEAARRLGVSNRTVIRLTAEGILERRTLGGRLSYCDAEQNEQIRRGWTRRREAAMGKAWHSLIPSATPP